jgi:hypothetical protein
MIRAELVRYKHRDPLIVSERPTLTMATNRGPTNVILGLMRPRRWSRACIEHEIVRDRVFVFTRDFVKGQVEGAACKQNIAISARAAGMHAPCQCGRS